MQKIVVIFPGQGSQYVGMGKNLNANALSYFDRANEALGFNLKEICFNGPEEKLKLTENTQPAIITHSLALFSELENICHTNKIQIQAVLGHSVGEYAALAAAQVLSFENAIKAVHLRGRFMQEATPVGVGKMFAIMRVPAEILKEACELNSNEEQQCMPANFNEPGQIVISGHAKACENTIAWLEENYKQVFKAVELSVSAPFHCSLMKPAEAELAKTLNDIPFAKNTVPYVANVNGQLYAATTNEAIIKENLIKQVCSSVLWYQSIQNFSEDTLFVECGPSRVLAGLNRKINNKFKTISLDTENSFVQLKELLKC
jgi:[acyl-carrier-protein] S-malonyltransferase